MSDITLYGFPVSTHVRVARLAFHEKSVPVVFEKVTLEDLATEAYGAINPFRKMPALRHGNVTLYETLALITYAEAIGTGGSLEPRSPRDRARMWQFVGIAQNYLHPIGAMQLYFHSVLAGLFGMTPDDGLAAAAVAPTTLHLDVIEAGLTHPYLAGDAISHADLYCGAAVDYIARTRAGAALLEERPNTSAWLARLRGRDSFQATFPDMLIGTDQA